MRYLLTSLASTFLFVSVAVAQDAVTCGSGKNCPENLPCCSRMLYPVRGYCGYLADLSVPQNTASVGWERTALGDVTQVSHLSWSPASLRQYADRRITSSHRSMA